MAKNPPANAGDIRDANAIPGSRRSPGEGNGYSLQYACLENPMDRGAWWVVLQRVVKGQTRLKQLSTHVACEAGLFIPVLQLEKWVREERDSGTCSRSQRLVEEPGLISTWSGCKPRTLLLTSSPDKSGALGSRLRAAFASCVTSN